MNDERSEHLRLWKLIDNIAYINKISVSALAKKAGLDATTFNKSKRFYSSGQPRWPTTESLLKVIKAMDMTWQDFFEYFD